MAPRNINRHTLLAVKLLALRRHLMGCRNCRSYRITGGFDVLCDSTKYAILEIAEKWDSNIPGRLASTKEKDGLVFPCPDVNAHGPAYAASAEAIIITARQDTLF